MLKIFTALVEVMPDSYEMENHLISVAEKSKCQLDIGFYNCIMKKRFMRKDDVYGQVLYFLVCFFEKFIFQLLGNLGSYS